MRRVWEDRCRERDDVEDSTTRVLAAAYTFTHAIANDDVLLFISTPCARGAADMNSSYASPPADSTSYTGLVDFIGPGLLVSFLQSFETGIILSQALRFYSTAKNEAPVVKCCVVFVTIASVMQTCFCGYDTWLKVVKNFGNWARRNPSFLPMIADLLPSQPGAMAVYWPSKILHVMVSNYLIQHHRHASKHFSVNDGRRTLYFRRQSRGSSSGDVGLCDHLVFFLLEAALTGMTCSSPARASCS